MEYDSTNEYWYTLNLEYYFENQLIKGGISDVQKFRIHLVDFMKDKIIKKKIDLPSSNYTTNLFISEDNRYLISCFFTSFSTFNEIQIWEVQRANLKLLKNLVLPFTNFEYCIFDEDFIYMIDLYNTKGTGFHDQMPYRILVFDLNSLELKQIIDDLNAKICPKNVYLKSVQKTKSNQWIWCTDKIYILNAKLELEKEIYFNLDYYPRISIQKEGNFLSVNKNNDVFILDLVKDTVYSLKEKSFV
jgi:hypothetical protein